MTAKARYGFAAGSGERYSTRVESMRPGLTEGMRTSARRVEARPLDADRRLDAGHQALVGVHPLVGDRRDLGRVAHETRR